MKQIYSDIIQFRGTHYDFGVVQGKLLKDSLTVKNREQQLKTRRPCFHIDITEVRKAQAPVQQRTNCALPSKVGRRWDCDYSPHQNI
jgi:predicted choloylglycine hydrolase